MSSDPRDAFDPDRFREQGHALVDQLADYLARAYEGGLPVMRWRAPDAMAEAWPVSVGPEPTARLAEVAERVLADASHLHHPRCFGHQVAVPRPDFALTDLLVALLNNGMASYDSGPVSSAIERNVVRWLADRASFPEGADGVLTSGGTLGTLTALLAARHRAPGHDPEGGSGPEPMAVLTSAHAHYAVARAAVVMGWGHGGVVRADVDAAHRLRAEAVARAHARARTRGRRVVAVVATAGTSVSGAFDPLGELADYCEREGLWLHVDAAHGASALLCPEHRHLLEGVERVDSLVWDAHKLLALPALVTAVLFRDGAASYAPFVHEAEYVFAPGGEQGRWYDYGIRNLECTKRMMSVGLYAALACAGTDSLGASIASRFALARRFARVVAEADDFELAIEPQCNIVCFRYAPGGMPWSSEAQDRIRDDLVQSGRFFFTRASIDGEAWMRVTLMNPLTTEDDLEALLDAVREAARALQ